MDSYKVWVAVEGDAAEMLISIKRKMEDAKVKQKSKPLVANKVLNSLASYLKENNLTLEYNDSKIIIIEK